MKNNLKQVKINEFEEKELFSDLKLKKFVCKKCNSDKFLVGKGIFQVNLKCPKCKCEQVISYG